MTTTDPEWDHLVTISRGDLEVLLWFAQKGARYRSWRTLWRWRDGCGSPWSYEPECADCRTFMAARVALSRASQEIAVMKRSKRRTEEVDS